MKIANKKIHFALIIILAIVILSIGDNSSTDTRELIDGSRFSDRR